jgi:ribosomal protein S18 acetylase RimI-like enzyme
MMTELEERALARGVRLLFLDTSEGYGGARALYDTQGYVYVGGIPDYALDPDGTPAKNAIYYKMLRAT